MMNREPDTRQWLGGNESHSVHTCSGRRQIEIFVTRSEHDDDSPAPFILTQADDMQRIIIDLSEYPFTKTTTENTTNQAMQALDKYSIEKDIAAYVKKEVSMVPAGSSEGQKSGEFPGPRGTI